MLFRKKITNMRFTVFCNFRIVDMMYSISDYFNFYVLLTLFFN